LTKTEEEKTIIISRSGRSTHPARKGSSHPRRRTCISEISGDGKLSVSAGEIGKSFEVNALHKRFRCNDQLHRPIDTSVMRPITGTSPGHHVAIEGPDCGCVEYGPKFDPYRRVLPFTWSVEGSAILGDTTIVSKSGVNLPGVRHAHFAPGTDGVIGSVPTLLLTNASRISPKPPLAAQAHRLRRGQVRCFLACRESRRAHGARSEDYGLSKKLSTRMHSKIPCPITITCE
jgi:hypothetical protein